MNIFKEIFENYKKHHEVNLHLENNIMSDMNKHIRLGHKIIHDDSNNSYTVKCSCGIRFCTELSFEDFNKYLIMKSSYIPLKIRS